MVKVKKSSSVKSAGGKKYVYYFGDGAAEGESEMMRRGGMIRGPGTGTSDSIPGKNTSTGGNVKVSNGEYIIPAKIVAIKGKEFFDNLLRKYSDVSGERT